MPQTLVDAAVRFWQGGQPAQAAPLLRRVLAIQPEHADLWLLLAFCLMGDDGTAGDGLAALGHAYRLRPDFRQRHPPEAERVAPVLERALLAAVDALAGGRRGDALALSRAARRLEGAETAPLFAELEQAAAGDGFLDCEGAVTRKVVDLCFHRGRLAAHHGDPATAAGWYRRAIHQEPRHFYLYHFLGEALYAAGRPFEALDAYTRAQTIHGADVPSLMKIASLENVFGYHRRALDAARRCLAITDHHDMIYVVAVASYHLGDFATATAALNRIVGQPRLAANAHFFLSLIALRQGDGERALAAAQASIAASEQNVFAYLALARAALAVGRPADATAHAGGLVAAALALARDHRAAGRFPEAAEQCQAALLSLPWETAARDEARTLCRDIHAAIMTGDLDALHRSYYWNVAQAMEAVTRYVELVETVPALGPAPAPAPARGPVPAAVRDIKIWDGFIFNDELDLLRCRIDALNDEVDHFVIVESSWTFRGTAKEPVFARHADRFADVAHKIRHVVIDTYCHGLPWDHEAFQRNGILRGLEGAGEDDVVIVADIDELPRPETLAMLRRSPDIAGRLNGLGMRNFKYYLNLQLYQTLVRSAAAPYGLLRRMGPNYARWLLNRNGLQIANVLDDAGWHFSSLGGVAAALKKYREDSHVEKVAAAPTHQELERLLRRARQDADGQALRAVPIDDSYPAFVRQNLDRMRALGWLWEG